MKMTLKQAYDLFIFDRETYCKQKTIRNYKNTLSYFFDFLEEERDMPITKIQEQAGNTSVKAYGKSSDHKEVYPNL